MVKPTVYPLWTDGVASKVTEPSLGKRDLGYVEGEKPSALEMNWLFYLNGEWVQHFDSILGIASLLVYPNQEIGINGVVASDTTTLEQVRYISGLGGTNIISQTPFGNVGGWTDGLKIILQSSSSVDRVKILHNDNNYGALIRGDWEGYSGEQIILRWNETRLRWVEDNRS